MNDGEPCRESASGGNYQYALGRPDFSGMCRADRGEIGHHAQHGKPACEVKSCNVLLVLSIAAAILSVNNSSVSLEAELPFESH